MWTWNSTTKSGQICPGVQMGRPSDVMVASPGCTATICQDWSPSGAGMGTRNNASPGERPPVLVLRDFGSAEGVLDRLLRGPEARRQSPGG